MLRRAYVRKVLISEGGLYSGGIYWRVYGSSALGEHTHSFTQFYIFLHELFKKYYCFGLHCGPQV